MKKLLFASLILLIACKKKEDPKEEEPVTPKAKQFSAKINNNLYTCDACANTYFSGGLHGVNIAETGGGTNRFIFNFDTLPSVGTHPLVPFSKVSFSYEKNRRYYRGRGSMNITAVEKGSSGSMNVFKATFSCQTDTASDGTHFNFTEGDVNLNFK